MSKLNRGEFEKDPVGVLGRALKDYMATAPGNRLADFGDAPIFDDPLIGIASGSDYLFDEYKLIIGGYHLTPREAIERHCQLPKSEPVSAISIILPINRETRLTNRKQTQICSARWNHTLGFGQPFVDHLSGYAVSLLEEIGLQAVDPELEKWYSAVHTCFGNSVNFSHRHVAFAAGLGTFGLNDGFITSRGVAMRCTTVVTNASLPPTPRIYGHHYANCLFYHDGSCRACIKRCPAGAITEQGRDNEKCRKHRFIQDEMIRSLGPNSGYKVPWGRAKSSYGCGLCETKVPCEDRIPVPASVLTA